MNQDPPALTRRHHQRLREIYRSAGWPCHDMLEVELLAAGLLERRPSPEGFESLRVTDAGVRRLAEVFAQNKAVRTPHEALVERVAIAMAQAGRLTWRGLMLRVALPQVLFDSGVAAEPAEAPRQASAFEAEVREPAAPVAGHVWCMACPDVFSVRHTTVEAYLEPVVHEIKVSRADLLGDLKKPAKRAAYLAMAGACWYVLGQDAKGRPIAEPEEIPAECGVLQLQGERLVVAREAPRRAVERLPFHVWMALARSGPAVRLDDDAQSLL
ncbi:hypothetical protein [Hydrogenophaga sp.]|uniref:hypothetical protein n=1 Tax=Hydrogenophaga sp. TaxID=1904254 RepID=UPI0026034FF4|nr:hypothetical protein [Hydrogenophaga sp.]MCW5654509.1 hypothetical protein [Hydrogenophaga sp.]